MLLLLFQVGDNLYALDSDRVTEVIPLVVMRKIHHVPDYVAGAFNYRGDIVPVIDLCHLIQGTACHRRFSTRIIMINYCGKTGICHHFGLMAERVTETLHRPDLAPTPAEQTNTAPYLGNLFMDEKGMIQQIHWEQLISGIQPATLLAGGMLQKNDTSSN